MLRVLLVYHSVMRDDLCILFRLIVFNLAKTLAQLYSFTVKGLP